MKKKRRKRSGNLGSPPAEHERSAKMMYHLARTQAESVIGKARRGDCEGAQYQTVQMAMSIGTAMGHQSSTGKPFRTKLHQDAERDVNLARETLHTYCIIEPRRSR